MAFLHLLRPSPLGWLLGVPFCCPQIVHPLTHVLMINPDTQTSYFPILRDTESEMILREIRLERKEFLISQELGWGVEEATARFKNQSVLYEFPETCESLSLDAEGCFFKSCMTAVLMIHISRCSYIVLNSGKAPVKNLWHRKFSFLSRFPSSTSLYAE